MCIYKYLYIYKLYIPVYRFWERKASDEKGGEGRGEGGLDGERCILIGQYEDN